MLRHLFPSFDGPVRASPYFCTPRRQRWWPMAVAFGAGMACVLILIASWKETDRSAEQTAIHWTTLPADAADAAPQTTSAAPAAENQQANAGASTPAEVQTADHAPAQPETPVPMARPHTAAAPAGGSTPHQAHTQVTNGKASDSKTAAGRSTTRTASVTPPSAPNQAAGMVRIDEEELPDGRRVPVYRRPTIFDGVRNAGSQ
jgi:hypothetical protein